MSRTAFRKLSPTSSSVPRPCSRCPVLKLHFHVVIQLTDHDLRHQPDISQ
ncbi:hypothetical protein I553_10536 [Mycobacterium xenopi 4042]|uniref:Uncharacterized protein n=1 Tax=Mycobacterium xenopi 4042 TaxID=1299334 RepID=X8DLN7_MYCXE|nr:hypothetical protein I553_10536 [Mycobacterium xenopi 4042]